MNIWEEKFKRWSKPPSDTEENKLKNAKRIVYETLINADEFKNKNIDIFGQGSYANYTNIRLNSDIDINACYQDTFFYDIPDGFKKEDFDLIHSSSFTFREYKNQVEAVLRRKFDSSEIERKNKCLKIKGNSYRVECDIVPTFLYRRYDNRGNYVEGTKLMSDDFQWVLNFPKQHIDNGKIKNSNTQRRFKRSVRVFKQLKVDMKKNNVNISEFISSFLIESLVWNAPNYIFNNNNSWYSRMKNLIIYLYNNTVETSKCKEWSEISNLLYLFHSGRKWNVSQVNKFIVDCWQYIEYSNE